MEKNSPTKKSRFGDKNSPLKSPKCTKSRKNLDNKIKKAAVFDDLYQQK